MTDIYEKINSGYYNNPIGYPGHKPNTFNCQSCGVKVDKDDNFCKGCGFHVNIHIENVIKEWSDCRNEYEKAELERHERFKSDALNNFGYLNHPKADLIYAKAWEEGHAHGFSEIFTCLGELCQFLDRFLE